MIPIDMIGRLNSTYFQKVTLLCSNFVIFTYQYTVQGYLLHGLYLHILIYIIRFTEVLSPQNNTIETLVSIYSSSAGIEGYRVWPELVLSATIIQFLVLGIAMSLSTILQSKHTSRIELVNETILENKGANSPLRKWDYQSLSSTLFHHCSQFFKFF